jgi:hypothetical protein
MRRDPFSSPGGGESAGQRFASSQTV